MRDRPVAAVITTDCPTRYDALYLAASKKGIPMLVSTGGNDDFLDSRKRPGFFRMKLAIAVDTWQTVNSEVTLCKPLTLFLCKNENVWMSRVMYFCRFFFRKINRQQRAHIMANTFVQALWIRMHGWNNVALLSWRTLDDVRDFNFRTLRSSLKIMVSLFVAMIREFRMIDCREDTACDALFSFRG